MNTYECIATRRSSRKYEERPVEREKLEKIIDAGRMAPSGGNSQTTHFIAITSKKVLDELAGIVRGAFSRMEITEGMYRSIQNSIRASKAGSYVFHYNAPVLIVAANKKGYGNAMADSACALMNMMLEANELDLGSCWINQLHWLDEDPEIHAYLLGLGLGEDETVCGSLAVGYAEILRRKTLPRTGNPVTYITE